MASFERPENMEKYRRVMKKSERKEDSKEDEIRITAKGRPGLYVAYAAKLFQEKELPGFTLKATGQALGTAVVVAEVIKRRFKGLHQITTLGSTVVEDEWEPLEEGLDAVTSKRNVSFIEIELSTKSLDAENKGYQEPIDESLVTEYKDNPREGLEDEEGGKPRRKGRGKRGSKKGSKKGEKKGKGKGEKGEGKSEGKRSGSKGGKGKGKRKGSKGKGKGRDRKGSGSSD